MNNIDFVLKEDDDYRVIFRFYPNLSHCHSFNDDLPKNWDEVYKIYYSYAIIGESEDELEVLFDMDLDECSALEYLNEYIEDTIQNKRNNTVRTLGQPGSDWELIWKGSYIKFQVFNNWTNQGFRFKLAIYRVKDFMKYLNTVNQYMLEHGESI